LRQAYATGRINQVAIFQTVFVDLEEFSLFTKKVPKLPERARPSV